MSSSSSADQVDDSPASRLPLDHSAVTELYALLAYAEIAAFYRLTDEAKMAPNLRGRISMARIAAAEMGHYEVLRDALETRGVDVVAAMSKYVSALENYHRLTTPSTWLEALVKTYVADALASELYLEIAGGLPDECVEVIAGGVVGDRALAIRRRRGAQRGDRQQQTAQPAGAVGTPAVRRNDHPGPVPAGRPR